MIYLITNREEAYKEILDDPSNEVKLASILDFQTWYARQESTNLDTETNVVEGLYSWLMEGPKSKRRFARNENGERIPVKRLLYTVQIGDVFKRDQFIFDNVLNFKATHGVLRRYFSSDKPKFLHNALFDNSVILFNLGVNPKNIKDTMLLSHILNTGLDQPKGYHSFAGCLERYLNITLSKDEQENFTDAPMSMSQLTYAALDVVFTYELYQAMWVDIEKWNLKNVVTLEEAVLRPYAHSMTDNFYLNIDAWKVNMKNQDKILKDTEQKLKELVIEYFPEQMEKGGYLNTVDKYEFNWRSSLMVKNILKALYPNMEATTKPARLIYYKSIKEQENSKYLGHFLQGNYEILEKMLITDHHNLLEKLNIFTPKGKFDINFNSPPQMLYLFQCIKPTLTAVNKTALSKLKHPIKTAYSEYNRAAKLVQSYGQNFLDAINPDGMLRPPGYKQIVSTGRSSMNLYQLLPAHNSYRNAFYYKPGYKIVAADFASQEAVIAATVCEEPTMLKIFENGWDFHSYCAAMLFPEEWQKLGGDPEPKDKPADPLLVKRRNATKATSFGIFYGKTAVGLGETLDIPANTQELVENNKEEANTYLTAHQEEYMNFILLNCNNKNNKTSEKEFLKFEHEQGRFLGDVITAHALIERFYNTFPNVKTILLGGAKKAVQQNWIATKDLVQRVRFFERPDSEKEAKAIEREAMNLPIQGSGANMTKLAIAHVYKYIEENDLHDKIKFLLPIHDEIVTAATVDIAEDWSKKLVEIMENAGKVILKHDLQKAEANISDGIWMK